MWTHQIIWFKKQIIVVERHRTNATVGGIAGIVLFFFSFFFFSFFFCLILFVFLCEYLNRRMTTTWIMFVQWKTYIHYAMWKWWVLFLLLFLLLISFVYQTVAKKSNHQPRTAIVVNWSELFDGMGQQIVFVARHFSNETLEKVASEKTITSSLFMVVHILFIIGWYESIRISSRIAGFKFAAGNQCIFFFFFFFFVLNDNIVF